MCRFFKASFVAALALAALPGAAHAQSGALRAGVGKADITPKTGYYLGGWTRADRTAQGQHTRLHSRALVLQRGARKVALVQVDLFMVPAGMVKHVAQLNAGRGFSEQNVLISASHTHSGPGGYANFKTFNTAAPSLETATDPISFYRLLDPKPADPQLYRFLVTQIAAAVRRADADLGRAEAGWGSTEINGLTRNRSIEAHLANHGITREFGQGDVSLDPSGVAHSIVPQVSVLRVDKLVRQCPRRRRRAARTPAFTGQACPTRRVPVGGWSTFAAHGTVTKSSFEYYNQDHHASALRVFEDGVRRSGKVPARQHVLNVFGNSNEGDQSAGLERHGPAASDYVGRVEAAAMLRAWRGARGSMSSRPALDLRWTRACFCGQATQGGNVADYAMAGIPFLTGSEEERGPLFDVTKEPLEGRRNPLPVPGQGHKIGIPIGSDSVPKAVPLMVVRVGDRLIATLPGEGTAEVGGRVRAAVQSAAAGAGISRVIVSGLANDFIQYFTTPEEYDRQHYEGGSTLYGPLSAPFLSDRLAELSRSLATGAPAPEAYPFDPVNGVPLDGPVYGSGAAGGRLKGGPRTTRRLGHAAIDWNGGPEGLDRPVDRAFVHVQRRVGRRWRTAATDLGLNMLWTVDGDGQHVARWEIPLSAKSGRYRFVVTAKRYRFATSAFKVLASRALRLREVPAPAGRVAVELHYPPAVRDVDLTHRPERASGGTVRFRVGGRTVTVRRRSGTVFSVAARAGASVSVPGGGAADRFGNVAGTGLSLAP